MGTDETRMKADHERHEAHERDVMSDRPVFVLVCKTCGEVKGALDPMRCEPIDIGHSVAYAAEHGHGIELRESPVTIGKCQCGLDVD